MTARGLYGRQMESGSPSAYMTAYDKEMKATKAAQEHAKAIREQIKAIQDLKREYVTLRSSKKKRNGALPVRTRARNGAWSLKSCVNTLPKT